MLLSISLFSLFFLNCAPNGNGLNLHLGFFLKQYPLVF